MIIATRRLRALGVLAVLLGACTPQIPAASPPVTTAGPGFSAQAAGGDEATVEGSRKPGARPHPGRGDRPSPRPPKKREPQPRRPAPQPDPRYRDPDYRDYPPDTRYRQPVTITRAWAEAAGDTIIVRWTTDVPSTGRVAWGSGDEVNQAPWQYARAFDHSYTLRDVEPDTAYWYRITARSEGGGTVTSPTMTVRTEP